MPIHERDGAYQVVVWHAGQKHRRSSKHWTKAQAREVEAQLRQELHDLDLGRQPSRTFNDAVEKWLKEVVPRQRERSAIESRQNLAHIAPMLERRKLAEAASIAAEIRAKWPNLSPSTVNRRLAVLSRLCQLAAEWGWISHAPKIGLLTERRRENFLTAAQVEAVAARSSHHGDAVLMAAYTGIRMQQLLNLTEAHRRDGCLHLGRDGKTGQPQVVPLHPRVAKIRLPLTSTYPGFYKAFKAACAELGIVARPHDLRHTLASWMLQSGADLLHVRDMLGHSSVTVTQRYTHLRTADLRLAVEKIGSTGHKTGHKRKGT